MRSNYIFVVLFILIFLSVGTTASAIDSPLKDPMITDNETSIYRVETKSGVFESRDSVKISFDKKYYVVESRVKKMKRVLKLSRKTMFPVKLDVYNEKSNYKIHSSKNVEFLSDSIGSKTSTIPVISNFDLEYALRGFPFEKPVQLPIEFLSENEGERNTNFEISVRFAGIENIVINDKTIPSYVLEFKYKVSGMFIFFKSMFPKTTLWYSVEKPHYLVKYESIGGQGDMGNMTVQLIHYSGWQIE